MLAVDRPVAVRGFRSVMGRTYGSGHEGFG